MFLLHRPSPTRVARFVEGLKALPLSYEPVPLAAGPAHGFSVDEQTTTIGAGVQAFDRACAALERWEHFNLGWLEVFPPRAPLVPGTVVCVRIRHLGFWSLNGCRVVYTIGTRTGGEYGYAYGTLRNHAETGEEIFKVTLDPGTGAVGYTIRAASRPRALLAQLGYPVTRHLQARFRRDSAVAMARAVAG